MILPRYLTGIRVEEHGARVRWRELLPAAGCVVPAVRKAAGALTLASCIAHRLVQPQFVFNNQRSFPLGSFGRCERWLLASAVGEGEDRSLLGHRAF
jgi:hypothetical protein